MENLFHMVYLLSHFQMNAAYNTNIVSDIKRLIRSPFKHSRELKSVKI